MSELTLEEKRRIREEYHQRLRRAELREGFAYLDDDTFKTRPYWPLEPKNRIRPHLWKWDQIRSLTIESGEMIGLGHSRDKYDRRVLALTNPGVEGEFTLSGTFFGDIQLIKPGEAAPAHRHTPCATRFILEGEGGWTTVSEERVHVQPGDVVFTGQFAWHGHGNEGSDDFIFLDVLDIPLLQYTATSAWEFDYETVTGSRDEVRQPAKVTDHPHAALADSELRPCFSPSWTRRPEDFAHLRWRESRARLLEMSGETGSPWDGLRLEFTNRSGGPIGPTMSIFTQMLRPHETTFRHRHTSSTIYVVAEGGGTVTVENQRFEFAEKDIFVVPSWHWHSFANPGSKPCFLHSISDASLVHKMGLFREQRETATGKILETGWSGRSGDFPGEVK